MKILNLFFKNINSLEGENRINFEQPPFTDTGVFAITGPNGSGKSSILDAITLALYGETFRFNKPAQHIITQHTDHSLSQVEFAVGADKFRSQWRVKREGGNPLGHVLPSEMSLTRINGTEEVIAITPHEVCDRMVEITGMNFRSFTRSILLAQGDFAAFLNALDNERMDILEKLVSPDIYADYKKAAADKLAEAQKQLTYLQQDLAAVPLISPESLAACAADLGDFNDQVTEFRTQIDQYRQLQASLGEGEKIKAQIEAKEARLQEAIAQRLQLQKTLEQLEDGEIALAFQQDIEETADIRERIERSMSELNALKNESKQIEAALKLPGYDLETPAVQEKLANLTEEPFSQQKQTIESLRNQLGLINANWQSEILLEKTLTDQIAEKQSELDNIGVWLGEHSNDRILLDNFPDFEKLKALRGTLNESEEKKKTLTKASQSTGTALQKNKDDIRKRIEIAEKLKLDLISAEKNLAEAAQGHTLSELEELHAEQKERVNNFQELVNLAAYNEKLQPKPSFLSRLFGKPEPPDRQAEELENELADLKAQVQTEENIRLALERAVFNDALIARMAHDRNYLIDGKPCPLCGATEHPYANHLPAPANSQQALVDQRIKIKRLMAGINDLEEQVRYAHRRIERNKVNNKQQQQVQGRWLTLCNLLNVAREGMTIDNIDLMRQLLKSEMTELRSVESLLNDLRNAEKQIAKIQDAIEKNNGAITELHTAAETIGIEAQSNPLKLEEHEAAHRQIIQAEAEFSEFINQQLTSLGEKLPNAGKEDLLINGLRQRRLDYQSYIERSNNLREEISSLKSKQSSGLTQIESYKTRVESINSQLQLEEIIGLHLTLVEKQKLIAGKEDQVNTLIAEAEAKDKAIAEKLADTKFVSLTEVNKVIHLMASRDDSAEQKAQLDINVSQWGVELDNLYQDLAKFEGDESKPDPENIELELKAIQEKAQIAEMEARRLEAIIHEQHALKQRYENITTQIQQQEAVVKDASSEVEEISSHSGLVLRRRVQTSLVEQLLSHTNTFLEKISGRYYVRQKSSERGLALSIEDTYQGNVQRLPKTLSGGESFIVSLALALGLSELASHSRSVDSLFLDEGFGNLDAETLFTVVNTLEGLRAHGKMVGVISHVEAVQKRFKAQLQLVKKPNGLGELRKVS